MPKPKETHNINMKNWHNPIKAEWFKNGNISKNVSEMYNYQLDSLEVISCLKRHDKNRNLNEKHVKDIYKALAEGEDVGTVTVEMRTGIIIDGQHRIEALRRFLNDGGTYVLTLSFKDCYGDMKKIEKFILDMNNKQAKWKDKDYLEYFREPNNAYDKLYKWACEHELTHTMPKSGKNKGIPTPRIQQAAIFVQGAAYKRTNIKYGLFNATDEDFKEASVMHDEVKQMLDCTPLGNDRGNWFEAFVIGWSLCRDNVKFSKRLETVGGFKAFLEYIPSQLRATPSTQNEEWHQRFKYVLQYMENDRLAA